MLITSKPPTLLEMLLGFIAGILNKYIGAYFEDIDVSQLTGSIFGGGVTLNNLNLRPSILESLGIPFHVVGGKCGQLEVRYSLTKLYSEPVVVILKDLHILIIPARAAEYNAEAEEQALQNEKMRQLEIFESVKHHLIHIQQRKGKNKRKDSAAQTEEETMLSAISSTMTNVPQEATYFDMWVMLVLRNIQFHVEGVHIRFEDSVTKPTEPFAVGAFLRDLQVNTTDSNWQSHYIKDYLPETSYKLAKVNGLSVYWNPAPTPLYKGIDDKTEFFQHLAVTPERDEKAYNMLFEPLSTDLRVQITPFPDVIQDPFSKPRVLIESSLQEIHLSTSDKQFKDILPFLETLEFLTRSHKYRKYRVGLHDVPYQGHYKEWWRFAYNCILGEIQRRRNNFRWEVILEKRNKSKKYLKAYYKRKMDVRPNPNLDQTISSLEHDLDLFMLILLRQQVDVVIARQSQPPPPPEEDYITWITSWFSTSYWFPMAMPEIDITDSGSDVTENRRSSTPNFAVTELTRKDKEIIRVAVGFAKNIDIFSYPDDYVALEAHLLLNKLHARIHRMVSRKSETVLDGLLEKVSFVLRTRPVCNGLEVEVKMGRVEIYGDDFPSDGSKYDLEGQPPLIATANPNVVEYFLKFTYELHPLDSEVDQKVSLEGLALQFTYLADSIDRIIECFSIPPRKEFPKKRNIPASRVLRKVMQFRNSPTTRLLRMMENKGKVELNICLIAPYLVLPQDSTTRGKANFVVVNLGEINLVGTLVGGTVCENGACSNFL